MFVLNFNSIYSITKRKLVKNSGILCFQSLKHLIVWRENVRLWYWCVLQFGSGECSSSTLAEEMVSNLEEAPDTDLSGPGRNWLMRSAKHIYHVN